jgi:uncharacterized protein
MTAPAHSPELTIPVHDLDAGGKEVQLPLTRAWMARVLEGTDIRPGGGGGDVSGELDVRLSKSGTDVVVHGELRGELVVACARCLEPAKVEIRESIAVLAVPGSSGEAPSPKHRRGRGAAEPQQDDEDG